jgi:hypothetical protein
VESLGRWALLVRGDVADGAEALVDEGAAGMGGLDGFLCFEDAGRVTGQLIFSDGGYSLV